MGEATYTASESLSFNLTEQYSIVSHGLWMHTLPDAILDFYKYTEYQNVCNLLYISLTAFTAHRQSFCQTS